MRNWLVLLAAMTAAALAAIMLAGTLNDPASGTAAYAGDSMDHAGAIENATSWFDTMPDYHYAPFRWMSCADRWYLGRTTGGVFEFQGGYLTGYDLPPRVDLFRQRLIADLNQLLPIQDRLAATGRPPDERSADLVKWASLRQTAEDDEDSLHEALNLPLIPAGVGVSWHVLSRCRAESG